MSDTDTITLGETIDADLDLTVFTLAERADVRSPDNAHSPGAKFLFRLQSSANEVDADRLLEAIRAFVAEGNDPDDYGVNDLPSDLQDEVHEMADSDVQIYTYQCWQEFTDLCLYEEDVSDLSVDLDSGDLTKVAMAAEYVVASRTIGILLAERAQAILTATLAPYIALGQTDEEALLLLEHDQDEDLHAFVADVPDEDSAVCGECGDTREGLMHSDQYRSAEPLAESGE